MTVTGLGGDYYYIDNKIVVKIKNSGATLIRSVSLSIVNFTNGKTANLPLLYPNAEGELILDLSRIIKGLFTLPEENDDYLSAHSVLPNAINNLTITFTARLNDDTTETSTFTKNFVRGGNFNYKDNQQAIANTPLSPTYYLPYWRNYPFAYYQITASNVVTKYNPFASEGIIAVSDRMVLLPVKSCNGAYFRFLNSKGGFSYWLFDGYNDMIDINHFGDVDNLQRRIDLGSRSSIAIQVSGKVSDDHFPLMRDLITSPYIHLWKNEEWIQVYSDGNNKWADQSSKKAHKVSYRFNFFNQNNRSLLW